MAAGFLICLFYQRELLALATCSFDLLQILVWTFFEILFASLAAKLDLFAFVLDHVRLAHGAEFFVGDDTSGERIAALLLFFLVRAESVRAREGGAEERQARHAIWLESGRYQLWTREGDVSVRDLERGALVEQLRGPRA